jgi:mannosyltransferase OCH1-like enzyme
MIPKIIWSTYESEYDELPYKAKKFAESWKSLNPDWEYRYVSGKQRLQFVKETFGDEWYQIYNSYKLNVMRASLWRYMCLYTYGGLYVDLDTVCKKSIKKWLDVNQEFVVSSEPNNPGFTQMIFASQKNNLALKKVLDVVKKRFYENKDYFNIIEYSINNTGYVSFTNGIKEALEENPNLNIYQIIDEESENLHFNCIKHYRAGDGNVFGPTYKSWKNEPF